MSSFSIDNILAKPRTSPPVMPATVEIRRPYPFIIFPREQPVNTEPRSPFVFARKRRKRYRTIFSESQIEILEELYRVTPYPDLYQRESVAMDAGLQEERVEVWFKNRRARTRKVKRAQKELEAKDNEENANEKTEKDNEVKSRDEETEKETK